ncbi:MAG TPA: type II toxin-antitoxin system HicB family antitoxin [Saprospiraceae bacterium]|nr:type II toxin-antitoxin system HicB family antitoxin [Saprospiraceae bacterium]HMU05870.1 type II toxin-antitoxin system HicB family antitoxin [Saprospiraceae bacterium]
MIDIKYELIIYWSSQDDAFVVEVHELAGCKADGETYEEAIANVRLVINEWIETAIELGREIPKPKGKLMFA